MAEEEGDGGVWKGVMELTVWAQENNADPLLWSIQVTSALNSAAVSLPSPELAHRLVSHLCWDNHLPITWKFLEKAISSALVPPSLLLSLLSSRVLPLRRLHPSAYSLYLHLLNRHAFSLSALTPSLSTSLSTLLPLPHPRPHHPGLLLLRFIFTLVSQLLEASLEDEGLLQHTPTTFPLPDPSLHLPSFHSHPLHAQNTALALNTISRFLHHKLTSRILSLLHLNMYFLSYLLSHAFILLFFASL